MNKFIRSAMATFLILSMSFGSVQTFADNSKFFVDVNDNSFGWAASYVDEIASKGIASGVGNNMFAPASQIKRGDFAVFLDKTFKLDMADDTIFSLVDVSKDEYYYQSVVNCKAAKVITDKFNYSPEEYITRLDAIKMIYNALNEQKLLNNKVSNSISMYNDNADILNAMDKIAVGTLTNIEIINGSSDGNLYPNATMTRAEMAVIFAKTSEYVDNAKAEIVLKKEEDKQKAEEEAQAKHEESDEKAQITSGNINESTVIDSGKKVNVDDVTIKIDNQNEDALTIKNGSDVTLKDSSITSNGYSALTISDDAKLTLDNVYISAGSSGAINAKEGTNVSVEKLKVNVSDGGAVISAAAGAVISVIDTEINNSSKSGAVFKIVSDPNDSKKAVEFNLTNTDIDNGGGSLFYLRESIANIFIDNSDIEAYKFIESPYDRKNVQEIGNDVIVTITESEVKGDIDIDHKTKLTLDIQKNGSYRGVINKEGYAENVNVKLSADGKLELLADLYVEELIVEDFYFDNVIDNGYNIYYNDMLEANSSLFSDTYNMPYGGQVLPK